MPGSRVVLSCLLVTVGLLAGCASPGQQDLEAGLQLFRENKVEEALPLFQQAVANDDGNAEALAWLAEAHRRLGNKDEAVRLARESLRLEPKSSFAHLVIAGTQFPYGQRKAPRDSTWYHVEQAVASDSTDGNAWTVMWAKAVFEGDLELYQKVMRKMVETEFLTETALAYGRWELKHLPLRAILVTNGDMDTYPAQALQVTEQLRTDVAVVERGLLNAPEGRRFVRDVLQVPMPIDDADLDMLKGSVDAAGTLTTPADQILKGWSEMQASGMFARPIAFAPTVEKVFYKELEDRLVNAGAFLLLRVEPPAAAVDTATIRSGLGAIKPVEFAGPWVGEGDRSPIRRVYTKNVATNITAAAITYAKELIKDGRLEGAADALDWAEAFERDTEADPAFVEEIQDLKTGLRSTTGVDG